MFRCWISMAVLALGMCSLCAAQTAEGVVGVDATTLGGGGSRGVSARDAYGNAYDPTGLRRSLGVNSGMGLFNASLVAQRQSDLPLRRSLFFDNRAALTGLGNYGAGRTPRSGLFGGRIPRGAAPSAGLEHPARLQGLFRMYGGFRRRPPLKPSALNVLLARPRQLLQATSLNAPVIRALTLTLVVPPSSFDAVPFVEPDEATEMGAGELLSVRLQTRIEAAHQRAKADAWGWLLDGEFKRAVRSFEAAAVLDDDDIESRIATVFCRVSLGQMRTALHELTTLGRRADNLFAHDLDMTARYGVPENVEALRIWVDSMSRAADAPAGASSLRAFVLWFLDDRTEALAVAQQLARQMPKSPMARWPQWMRQVAADDDDSSP